MYKMPQFTEDDRHEVIRFMRAYPFITLITNNGGQSMATQIPVLIDVADDKITLRGHIMRNTDHHKAMVANENVLILFTGPHCYVSSSWYTEKGGATWNYQTVHVRGKVQWLDDEDTTRVLADLTHKYEQHQEKPLLISDMPEGYVSTLVKAIAGISITVEDVYPIFKLSQNKDDISYKNIVQHLQQTDDCNAHEVANEMIMRRPALFL